MYSWMIQRPDCSDKKTIRDILALRRLPWSLNYKNANKLVKKLGKLHYYWGLPANVQYKSLGIQRLSNLNEQ